MLKTVCLFLLASSAMHAQVLIYKGSSSCVKTGNGTIAKEKVLSYLIIDTTFNDEGSGKPNSALLEYQKNGKTYIITGFVDLDNELDQFEIYTITGAKGKSEQVILAVRQEGEGLYEVTMVKGTVKENQKLYKDEEKNTITGTLAKSLKGSTIGSAEGNSEGIYVITDCKTSFKFDSKLTAKSNPTGTASDFDTAIGVIYDALGITPPAP